ncbi:MAG TPA: GTP-binding protein [Candidatus Limnocylindria bacterium]|nr:GTP-binding protein [Candidatus Limnocylindria bacterium]
MSSKSNVQGPKPARARYIMIGGFLGAGKTTSVARLAERLTKQGQRVGLITNDQGTELVDTAMLRSRGFATEEIPGGCFCCRFNSLVDAAQKLTEASRPDVFIAEPVGSCTDLVATVTYPLSRIYGDDFSIAPLSVLVDPARAARVFGLEDGGKFSEKVLYIYRKQLEEADLIVINKSDSVEAKRLETLQTKLREEFPRAEVLAVSARTGAGLEEWFARLDSAEQIARDTMPVDYALYGEGEALLGWLNATVALRGPNGDFDGNEAVHALCRSLQHRLAESHAEVAHLKMTLSPDEGLSDLAVINLVRNDHVPELSQTLGDRIASGQLIVNLRAEAKPEVLRAELERALVSVFPSGGAVHATLEHIEAFKPGQPKPTHRDVVGSQ